MSIATLIEAGQEVQGGSAMEALEDAGLNWQARKVPLYLPNGEHDGDSFAIVRSRDDGSQVKLSRRAVGSKYTVIQNQEVFSIMQETLEGGKGELEACGTLDEGRRVWMLARLSEGLMVLPNDDIARYVLFANAFDGSSAAVGVPLARRFSCENQIAGIIGRSRNLFSIRHTINYADRLNQAYEAVKWMDHYYNMFGDALQGLTKRIANTNITKVYVDKMLPKPETKQEGRIESWKTKQETFNRLIQSGRGTNIPGVRGTFYGLWNATTEYADHHMLMRGERKLEGTEKAQKRALSLTFGNGENFKERGFKLLTGELLKVPTN